MTGQTRGICLMHTPPYLVNFGFGGVGGSKIEGENDGHKEFVQLFSCKSTSNMTNPMPLHLPLPMHICRCLRLCYACPLLKSQSSPWSLT